MHSLLINETMLIIFASAYHAASRQKRKSICVTGSCLRQEKKSEEGANIAEVRVFPLRLEFTGALAG